MCKWAMWMRQQPSMCVEYALKNPYNCSKMHSWFIRIHTLRMNQSLEHIIPCNALQPFSENYNFQEWNCIIMRISAFVYKYHSNITHCYALENFQRLVIRFGYDTLFFAFLRGTYLFTTCSRRSSPHMLGKSNTKTLLKI